MYFILCLIFTQKHVFEVAPPSPIPVYHDNLEIEEEATESSNIGSLVCHVVAGDGNCLFRAISHHTQVVCNLIKFISFV